MEQSSFATKFLSRLQKIDTAQIESFLTQLVKEKDVQQAILDSLEEGVLMTASDGRVVFANDAVRGLLGLGGRRIVGEQIRPLLRVPALQAVADDYDRDRQPVRQAEVRLHVPQPRLYAISVNPVGQTPAGPTHAIWIISDQTDLHRRAAERQTMDNLRSMATLTSGIAHEIRNPLNSLMIHAQLVDQAAARIEAHAEDDEGIAADAGRVRASTDVLLEEIARVERIVDQFIRAVRPVQPQLRTAQLNDVMRAIVDLVAPECAARRIELVTDLDPTLPPLLIDPEQIHQALLNIVKNALEAIDKPDGVVSLRTTMRGEAALVEITDNGCGIAEADRLRIFEPYHTTKFNGTGLGLMVVLRIVTSHGGRMAIDSEVGRGTVFRIALPLDERPVRLLGGGESEDMESPPIVGEEEAEG